MEIIVGKTAGFCYGVKRAIDGAKEELEKTKNEIFCLGEIVHNKQVVESLKNNGLIFIEDINEAKNKVILRAHGVTKEIYEIAKKRQIEIKDYTCPNVLKIHEIAQEYAKKGFYILLLGNIKHPENIGTLSYCGENSYVIEKEDDVFKALDKFQKTKIEKLLVISQTTFSLSFGKVCQRPIRPVNSITCENPRQTASLEMATPNSRNALIAVSTVAALFF